MEKYESIGKLFISTGVFHLHIHYCNLLMQLMLGLYGKGTCVFAVKQMYTMTPRHVVIKDCWDPSETISDELMHKKLEDPSHDRSMMVGGPQYILVDDHSE